jgi:outer membrane protein TolC
MSNINLKHTFLCLLGVLLVFTVQGQQVLTLKDAEAMALANYGTIKARVNQLNASKAYLSETKTEQLPDVTLQAQQDYGTANSQYGPLYGLGGYSVASSGALNGRTNWSAAFGSLYLSNVNWNFFAFGRAIEKVKVQQRAVNLNETDLAQEQFQQEVRVAGAYLNLLAAQELTKAQQDNLDRTMDVKKVVYARVINGLNPGVDSSEANSEVAAATIALTNAKETEAEQSNILAQYIVAEPKDFTLDSLFVKKLPGDVEIASSKTLQEHPLLQFYQNRINQSDEQAKYLATFAYPTFTAFGVFQGRGSGFYNGFGANPDDYSGDYFTGVKSSVYNYLLGVGVTWNITNPFRVHYQVKSQKFTSAQEKDDYDLISSQLHDQQILAETKIANALKNFRDVPAEVKAASDVYNQKSAQYKNGLANIVDFTQALYQLNRAEVDNYLASNNVWQALLYKAAATGDFGIFINNF